MHGDLKNDIEVSCVAVIGDAIPETAADPRVVLTEEDVSLDPAVYLDLELSLVTNSRTTTEQANSLENRQGHFDDPYLGLLSAGRPLKAPYLKN